MTCKLIGIPTLKFGQINALVEKISRIKAATEISSNQIASTGLRWTNDGI